MLKKMLETIEKHRLIEGHDRLLVALSGGPDSVALLHGMNQLKEAFDLEIFAVHLNHKIRGEKADGDQAYVEDLCRGMGIPLYAYEEDVPALSKRLKITEEEAGRQVRYEIFHRVCDEIGCQKVAVAQHRDDQVETFLMRIIRGSGLDGLGAIAYIREGKVIRPLLDITKEEIEDYLEGHGLKPRIDHTNFETDYLRNKIRLELIPLLKERYNPNISETIARNVGILQEEISYIQAEGKTTYEAFKAGGFKVMFFKRIHPGLKGRVLRLLIEEMKGDTKDLSGGEIGALRDLVEKGSEGKRREVHGFIFEISRGGLRVRERGPAKPLEKIRHELLEGVQLIRTPAGEAYEIRVTPLPPGAMTRGEAGTVHLDADKIKGPVILRNREPGDILRPLGMGGKGKKLKDFFIDEKVPREIRDKILIFENSGEIIWVYGYRMSETFKVDDQCREILKIEVRKL